MKDAQLPCWLPDWVDAEDEAGRLDVQLLRVQARELVELVLDESSEVLDSLPSKVESAMVTPLSILCDALDDGTDVELVVASRLTRRSVNQYLGDLPDDVRRLICELPVPIGLE